MKINLKIISIILSVVIVITAFASCGKVPPAMPDGSRPGGQPDSNNGGDNTATAAVMPETETVDTAIVGESVSGAQCEITLNGSSISVKGAGAVVDGSVVAITAAGSYSVTGKLDDGQIIVNTTAEESVKLYLNGVDIHCSNGPAIYVLSAPKKVVIYTQKGSVNLISDGIAYDVDTTDSDAPNAAIFSMEDLDLDGEGKLHVTGNYSKGIMSKDDISIESGSIFVKSVDDGIRGKDSVEMTGGYVVIDAGADGLRSSNDTDAEKGFILISAGELYIEAEQDGIQAETALTLEGGSITVVSGGGSKNSSTGDSGEWGNWGGGNMPGGGFSPERPSGGHGGRKPSSGAGGGNVPPSGFGGETPTQSVSDTTSAKGVKAAVSLTVSGGTLSIDSSDDALHTNGVMKISGGSIYASSGDDGAHADDTLSISGGNIKIVKSYEGLEAQTINISNGVMDVVASDDGLNAAGGNDGSSMGGRPGMGGFIGGGAAGIGEINITGGQLTVNASGDGIDSNGNITMSGGAVIVYGPTGGGNGILDFQSRFNMSGGTLLAVGGSDMAQYPTASGSVKVFTANASISESNEISIKNADGEELISFTAPKRISLITYAAEGLSGCSVWSGDSKIADMRSR